MILFDFDGVNTKRFMEQNKGKKVFEILKEMEARNEKK